MRFLSLFVLLAALLGLAPAQAIENRPGCDSCRIRVDSLDQPVRLVGTWLFTRDDSPQNAAAELDTSAWVLLKAPGPWKRAYDDKKVYTVGWYRGTFDFAASLVGQEVVLLLNTYMGRMQVHVDGQEVYHRPDDINVQRYFSIQAVPVRFKVTRPQQSVAIRVETPLMLGIYQQPFELRKYDMHDAGLVLYQVWGGEVRLVMTTITLCFGLFFLLVFFKVRYPLYLVAGLASLTAVPYFVAPSDFLLGIFPPEPLLYLHYVGLGAPFFFYWFAQFFHKFTPRTNWVLGAVNASCAGTIGAMALHPNVELFQHVRTVYFLLIQVFGFGACYMLWKGVRNRRPGAGVLLTGIVCYLALGTHDLLLAMGAISTIGKMHVGIAISLLTILYVASASFADTFVENKRLVRDLTRMNENLEGLVAERTLALRQKTHDIQSMLQNMPQGVLTVVKGNQIHPEYSAYLETIFESRDIAGRALMDVVFGQSDLGADALSQIGVTVDSCIGEDPMNYEFNAHLLAHEIGIRTPLGTCKSLELSWSPICDDSGTVEKLMICVRDVTELKRLAGEASAQKRELEMIGEILAVTQEKFQAFITGSRAFLAENGELLAFQAGRPLERALIDRLFRNMHTIKGNARTYGLLHLTNVVHEAEQAYDSLRQNPAAGADLQSLQAQLAAVKALVQDYQKINDTTLGRRGPGRRGNADRYALVERVQVSQALARLHGLDRSQAADVEAALAEVEHMLRRIGTEPVRAVISGVVESLPSLARELGKEPPVVQVRDQGVLLRSQADALVTNLITHLLRNSVDHGLETVEGRIAAGKPAQGRIDLDVSLQDNTLRMVLRDDGQGMALDRIRAIARDRRLAADVDQLSDEQVAQMIFLPGFSTAERVTEISGRGVGMDAVKGFLESEGGKVAIRFLGAAAPSGHRPFETVIELPGHVAVHA